MTRGRYALHLARRILESAAIAGAAGALAWLLEGDSQGGVRRAIGAAAAALAAHVLLGPKQTRPVFVRHPGALYAYGGVRVDRNAGCRGGLITGATGSGKTQACILPRLHSLCVHDPGVENGRWRERGLPRYAVPPWGGLVCGEKGNEWRWLTALLAGHGRGDDVRVLRTRPAGSGGDWAPRERLNLLGMDEIPADTYAKLIVETALAVEEADRPDEFFLSQARDKIAWGIRLLRAVKAEAAGPAPTLVTLHEILTVQDSYTAFISAHGADGDRAGGGGSGGTGADPRGSAALAEARFRLENDYWSQPGDQLGGVRSTIGNFLAPYTEPEVAEVFCADSSLRLRDMERGCVIGLALPQRHALQRRYVTALLKALAYRIILARYDRGGEAAEGGGIREAARDTGNVLLIEQDEWQRYAIRADGDTDVTREAGGTAYAATQSQNAVWAKFGGREKASPVVANLRNRWICQAATDECAEESSRFVGERVARQLSTSSGREGRTVTASFAERPFLPKARLRTLAPFQVVFAPAEGPVLYVMGIAMPVTPEGGIPPWWFGDWNPLHWLGGGGAPGGDREPAPPPWRAKAPLRAQVRRLLGLDGTFIVLERMSVRRAARLARRPHRE